MSLFLFHERVGDFFVVLFFLGVEGIVVWFRFGRFLVWFVFLQQCCS